MTSGTGSYAVPASATSTPPSRAASARSKRSGSSVCSVSSGCALGDRVAGLGVQLDAGAGLHRVLLAGPAGAEPPGGQADRHRVEPGEHARCAGAVTHVRLAGRRQRRRRGRRPGPRSSAARRPSPSRRRSLSAGSTSSTPGAREHLAGQRQGQLDDVGRAAAGQHLDRLRDLERVAGGAGPSGVDMSVSSATVCTPASVPSATIVSASSRALVDVLHERAGADLDVEHQRAGALGDLLAHDRGRDQRDRLDGAGDVAQRVELLVRRAPGPSPAAQITAPTSSSWASISSLDSVGPPAGDRLELVEGAAGVAEAAAGQLRHGDPAGRDQRRQRQGDLVADAAGGVLVGGRAATATEKSIRSPEAIIAAVQRAISRRFMPLSRIAIASADICSSATTPRV